MDPSRRIFGTCRLDFLVFVQRRQHPKARRSIGGDFLFVAFAVVDGGGLWILGKSLAVEVADRG